MISRISNKLRHKGNEVNYNALGLVTEAYRFNNAENVEKIYYKKNGTQYSIAGYVPVNSKLAAYPLLADSTGCILCNEASIGSISTTYVLDSYNNYDTKTGTWVTTGPNHYTTQIGATATFTFTGTGLNYYSVGTTAGGLWSFSVDGGEPIVLSTWRSATGYLDQVLVRGLTNAQHTVVQTFLGQDPAHPTASPRGWFYWGDEVTTGGYRVYRSEQGYVSDSEIMPSGVVEFAMNFNEWFPYHGTITMTPISRIVKIDGIEVTNWTANTALQECQKIEVIASYNTHASATPEQLLNRVDTHYTINKYGYYVEYSIQALQTMTILTGYGFMMPVHRNFATLLTDNNENTYSLTGIDNVRTDLLDGDNIMSLKATSSLAGKTNYQLCAALINPNALRIGQTDRGFPGIPYPLWTINNINDAAKNKIYCSTFKNHTMQAGEVFSAKNIYYIGMI